jgi:hypothetical protein
MTASGTCAGWTPLSARRGCSSWGPHRWVWQGLSHTQLL